jgi:hypothetical protein
LPVSDEDSDVGVAVSAPADSGIVEEEVTFSEGGKRDGCAGRVEGMGVPSNSLSRCSIIFFSDEAGTIGADSENRRAAILSADSIIDAGDEPFSCSHLVVAPFTFSRVQYRDSIRWNAWDIHWTISVVVASLATVNSFPKAINASPNASAFHLISSSLFVIVWPGSSSLILEEFGPFRTERTVGSPSATAVLLVLPRQGRNNDRLWRVHACRRRDGLRGVHGAIIVIEYIGLRTGLHLIFLQCQTQIAKNTTANRNEYANSRLSWETMAH